MLGFNAGQLVDRSGAIRPTFTPDGKFYYRTLTATGSEYVLINPADGSRKTAADLNGLGIANAAEKPAAQGRRGNPLAVVSPDGTREAYIKEYNLWMRDLYQAVKKRSINDRRRERISVTRQTTPAGFTATVPFSFGRTILKRLRRFNRISAA